MWKCSLLSPNFEIVFLLETERLLTTPTDSEVNAFLWASPEIPGGPITLYEFVFFFSIYI